jgi:hypothetical protein
VSSRGSVFISGFCKSNLANSASVASCVEFDGLNPPPSWLSKLQESTGQPVMAWDFIGVEDIKVNTNSFDLKKETFIHTN